MAFRIAVSGLKAATTDLNVTGNNIANSNTTGFKESRGEFADVYAASNLGTTQGAVGQGVKLTRVAQQFTQANISFTDNSLDMAINGQGFFLLEDGTGAYFSRAGAFGVDDLGNVVNGTGQRLQAYQATRAGAITGAVGDLNIDSSNIAPEATTNVDLEVNLNSGDDTNVHPNATFTVLTGFENLDGYSFTLDDGAGSVETVTLNFATGTGAPDPTTASGSDIANYVTSVINGTSNFSATADGAAVAVVADRRTATQMNMTGASLAAGHLGASPVATTTVGDGMSTPSNTSLTFGGGGGSDSVLSSFTDPLPFDPDNSDTFNWSTSLSVFDSLGEEHLMRVYARKVEPNLWETHVRIDEDNTQLVGARDISFDTAGGLTAATLMPLSYGVYTPTTGAAPMSITLDLTGTTQYGSDSGINALSQDGSPTGRLTGINIDDSGVVLARFSNGRSRVQGQVLLANFSNPQGLKPVGNTLWTETSDSGNPLAGPPGTASLGLLQAGALEESNVEVAEQLVNMIIAQRNFQANAQVIRAEDEVTQTIINIR